MNSAHPWGAISSSRAAAGVDQALQALWDSPTVILLGISLSLGWIVCIKAPPKTPMVNKVPEDEVRRKTSIPRRLFDARPPVPTGSRTNRQIRVQEVRIIDELGQQVGVLAIDEALRRADDAGLDLIEVAATADPPVCCIADLGRFRFEQEKRARDARKNQHVSAVKEVRLRPRTDEHDLQVRVPAARRFLEDGHKVKVEVRFRGREATHPEVARAQIGSIAAGVADIAMVERQASPEGRTLFAILARGRAPQT